MSGETQLLLDSKQECDGDLQSKQNTSDQPPISKTFSRQTLQKSMLINLSNWTVFCLQLSLLRSSL